MLIIAFDLGTYEAGCVALDGEKILGVREWKADYPKGSLNDRLRNLSHWLFWLFEDWGSYDGVVAVETPYLGQVRAVLALGQAVGLLRRETWEHAVDLLEVSPAEAKLALAMRGNATKQEVLSMAQALYPDVEWTQHTADALAVARAAQGRLRVERLEKEAQGEREDEP